MKYYKALLEMRCFTRSDVENMTGSAGAANSLLNNYQKKGYISYIKRNLYTAISMETGQSAASRYFIGSHITESAYLSHHSAFEYYGYANQVFYETYVSGGKRFAAFDFDGVAYRYIAPRMDVGVSQNPDGVRVTDIERTVIDSIGDYEKISGLEEVLRCLELIPFLNESLLMDRLEQSNKQVIYQKTGYLLSHMKKNLRLSDSFFEACEKKVVKSIRYLYHGIEHEQNTFDRRWQLIVPQNLMKIISEGEDANV